MNSPVYLTDKDFEVKQGKKGKILCCNLPRVSLVLFFSHRCEQCKVIQPIFHELQSKIQGCTFALINLSTYFSVATLSKGTVAEIKDVPFVVLYVDGKPFMKYTGKRDVNSIGSFVLEILARLESRNVFSNGGKVQVDEEVPEYGTGIPFNLVCDKDQCYLTFNEAFRKK